MNAYLIRYISVAYKDWGPSECLEVIAELMRRDKWEKDEEQFALESAAAADKIDALAEQIRNEPETLVL